MTKLKRKFISYLLIAAVGLLFVNIILDIFKKKNVKPDSRELIRTEIENTFWKVLDDYGIQASWVTKKKYRIPEEDSVTAQFFVTVPGEIPIPLIIRDINNIIQKDVTGFVAEEKKIFGTTEIRIYTNEMLKLRATLIPDPNLIRKKNEFSFVVSDGLDLGESRFTSFLNMNIPVACSVVPDPDYILKADSLSKFSKDFILLLNDDLTDSKMKLVPEYQKELLRSSIKNILVSFRKTQMIAVEEKSKLLNSPIYNFVRDEFRKRKYPLVPLTEFIRLENNDPNELVSKFKFYCEDTTASRQKIFYLTMDNLEKVIPLINKYKKMGNKILPIGKSYLAQQPVN